MKEILDYIVANKNVIPPNIFWFTVTVLFSIWFIQKIGLTFHSINITTDTERAIIFDKADFKQILTNTYVFLTSIIGGVIIFLSITAKVYSALLPGALTFAVSILSAVLTNDQYVFIQLKNDTTIYRIIKRETTCYRVHSVPNLPSTHINPVVTKLLPLSIVNENSTLIVTMSREQIKAARRRLNKTCSGNLRKETNSTAATSFLSPNKFKKKREFNKRNYYRAIYRLMDSSS